MIVCKDDYYCYLNPSESCEIYKNPYFSFGSQKLVVGWGHILENVFEFLDHSKEISQRSNYYSKKFADLIAASSQKASSEHKIGSFANLMWKWYHIGSSERFSKPYIESENIATCFIDRDWSQEIERYLTSFENEGFKIRTDANGNYFTNELYPGRTDRAHINHYQCRSFVNWMNRAKRGDATMDDLNVANSANTWRITDQGLLKQFVTTVALDKNEYPDDYMRKFTNEIESILRERSNHEP